MYYRNRSQAGRKLVKTILDDYKGANSAVVAISEGGLLVGEQIARMTHSSLSLLLTQDVKLPGLRAALGEVDERGTFTYNRMYSPGQLEEFNQEYLNMIAEEKMRKIHAVNRMIGNGGFIRPEILRNKVVFVVSDGAKTGLGYDVAVSFLKPIKTKANIAVAPIASVEAVDRMHMGFDAIKCGSIIDHFLDTDHYYDENDLPDRAEILSMIRDVYLHWVHPQLPNLSVA